MPDFVRVRDKDTGHELSVPAERVKNNPSAFTVLKEDAVNSAGVPLPPKYRPRAKASTGDRPPKVESILAEVGDDNERAAAALEVEQARGADARPTLVSRLQAIAESDNPPSDPKNEENR